MLLNQVLVGAAQPGAGHGEATVALNFRDTGFLQERQSHSARTDKDEVCGNDRCVPGVKVLRGHLPVTALAGDVLDLIAIPDFDTILGDVVNILASQGTEVNIRALVGPRNCHWFRVVTAARHQGQFLSELFVVIREVHPREQGVLAENIKTLTEETDLLTAVPERHVGALVNELTRIA